MKRALLLVALLAPLLGYSQSNVLYGTVSDYGIAPQSGIKCTLTLVSPNPRVVDGVFVRRDPIERTTSTNGYFSFTNIIWGKYTFQIAGKTTTEFGIYVQTNSTGSIPLGSLATTVTPPGPNPATNYYTMSQVDSLIANATAGTNSAFYQWGSLNLSNYSTLPTNTFQPALGYAPQFGTANLTNWAALGTNTLGLFAHNLNGSITNPYIVGGINMDSNQAAPAWAEGRVFYDTASHTLAYYNDNNAVTVNVGSEQLIRVRNRSGIAISDGAAVYISGALGQTPTVALALADGTSRSQVSGLATVDINDDAFGYVTVQGLVNGLNTSAYQDGAILYLSTNTLGGFTTNSYAGAAQVGHVAYSHNNQGKILVNVVPNSVAVAQQTNWPAAAITNAPWQIGSANLTNWSLLSTNVLSSAGQTNFPYQAITNAPWIETGSSGSVAQLSIGGSDAITFGQVLGDTFEFPHTVSAYGFIGSGAQLTAIPGAQITGNLTNNTSGNSAYATNAGTAAYVSGNLTNRVSFSTNAALASFVSGKLTNSISGIADEALFANSAGTATSATSANTANFATSATSATYARFATNAYSLFVSNLLQIGSSYPTILTSSSAGLSIDQPVTATSYTVGSGGATLTGGAGGLTNNNALTIIHTNPTLFFSVSGTAGGGSITGGATNINFSGSVGIRAAPRLAYLSVYGPPTGLSASENPYIPSHLMLTAAASSPHNGAVLNFSMTNSFYNTLYHYAAIAGIAESATNSATPRGYMKFGTTDGGTMTEKMRLTRDGRLGIGMTNPATLLDVNGTVTALSATITNTLSASNIVTTNITLYGTTATPPLLFSTNNALLSAVTPGAVEYGASNRALYFTTWLVRRSVPLAQNLIWSNAVENKPLIVTNTTAETPVYTFAMATNFIPRAGGKAWHVKLAGRHWSGNNQGFTLRTYIGSTDATNLLFTLDSPIAGTKSALQWKYDSMITAVSGDGTNNTFYANGDLLAGTASTQAGADDLVRNTLTQTNAMIVTISNSTTTATSTFLRQGWTTVIDQVPGQ